jgi:hypothetical protein
VRVESSKSLFEACGSTAVGIERGARRVTLTLTLTRRLRRSFVAAMRGLPPPLRHFSPHMAAQGLYLVPMVRPEPACLVSIVREWFQQRAKLMTSCDGSALPAAVLIVVTQRRVSSGHLVS